MRVATAYFAGAGTVIVAIAAGLGGGLLLGDIMSPQQSKRSSSEVTRLEQRMSPLPIPAVNGDAQPVPYMAATQVAATVADPKAQPQQPQAQSQQQAAQPPQAQQASNQAADPKPQPERNNAAQPAPADQPAVRDRGPEDSNAKAGDADLKRDARRAEDKRKWDRRERWSDKRKWRQRQDDNLKDVEASVRADTEQRPFFGRNNDERRYGRDDEQRSFFGRDERRFDRSDSRPTFGGDSGFGRIRPFESDD